MSLFNLDNPIISSWQCWSGNIQCSATHKRWEAKELIAASDEFATSLKKSGVSAGDIVALVIGNHVGFPILLMAALKIHSTPLLIHIGTPKPELDQIIADAHVKWVAFDPFDDLARIQSIDYHQENEFSIESRKIILFKTQENTKAITTKYYGCILQPSSGTYGKPSICLRTPKSVIAEAMNYSKTMPFYNRSTIRITTNLNHAYAFGFGLMTSILTNSTLIMSPVFNPKKILLEETNKTSDILALVPPMLTHFNYLKETNNSYRLPKLVFISGSACDQHLKTEFEKCFDSKLFTNYGTTETGAISTNYHSQGELPGVGKSLCNVEIAIRNQMEYTAFGDNVGEVHVKSTSMMLMSAEGENDDAEYFFNTQDLGKLDENKNLSLIGRKKDIINVNGMKIDPMKIENALIKHPLIIDCSVYPGRSPQGNEMVLAAIQAKCRIDILELKQHCYNNLNKHFVPDTFYQLDKIPRTPSGKCLKTRLPHYKI